MDLLTYINTIVGIIGIIVGIIGWKSLSAASKNNAKAGNGSTINQGIIYNSGIGEETVRLLTKDMTKEEMCNLIVRLIPIDTDDDDCIALKLRNDEITADDFEKVL